MYAPLILYSITDIMDSPDFAMAYSHRAAAYSQKSQYDMTVSDYSQAIHINPKFAEGFYNQGTIYTEKGIIEIDPKLADAFYNRGNIHYGNGSYDMAISDYAKAIEINPDDVHAYNKKAWILATCADARFRDGDEAVALAKKAVEMSLRRENLKTL